MAIFSISSEDVDKMSSLLELEGSIAPSCDAVEGGARAFEVWFSASFVSIRLFDPVEDRETTEFLALILENYGKW